MIFIFRTFHNGKTLENENIRLEEDLHYLNKAISIAKRDPVFSCDTNLEPDLERKKNEEVLNEKGKAISELIDMKAELEQEKLRSAKKLQEKDQDLTEALKIFDDLKNESLKKYRQYVEILQEKDKALAEASNQLISIKAEVTEIARKFLVKVWPYLIPSVQIEITKMLPSEYQ